MGESTAPVRGSGSTPPCTRSVAMPMSPSSHSPDLVVFERRWSGSVALALRAGAARRVAFRRVVSIVCGGIVY